MWGETWANITWFEVLTLEKASISGDDSPSPKIWGVWERTGVEEEGRRMRVKR